MDAICSPHFINEDRLNRVYAHLMINHPYGWALYKKHPTSLIQVGDCGYFDEDGDWCPIVRLTDVEAVATGGWAPFQLDNKPDDAWKLQQQVDSTTWGAKESKYAHQVSVGGTVGSTTVVAPVEVGLTVKYENTGEEAGVLFTSSPVTCQRFVHPDLFIDWMKRNNDLMVNRHGNVASTHGISIITKTYSADRAAKAVMRSKSSSVTLRVTADVTGVLMLTPESSWGSGHQDTSAELHSDDSGVVVFLSGVYFGKPLFSSTLKAAKRQERQVGRFLRGRKDGLPERRTLMDEGGNKTQLVLSLVPEPDELEDDLSEDDSGNEEEDDEDVE